MAIKTIIKRNITKKKKKVLFAIVLLLPLIGVFVPLFMFAEEDTEDDFFDGIKPEASDKLEVFDQISSEKDIDID